jgi:VWFA-related protein
MKAPRNILLIVLFALSAGITTRPEPRQTSSQDGVIRINVNLVQVDAVVTDGGGKPVKDLSAEDFEVLQDGKPQVITNFAFINVRDRSVKVAPAPKAAVQPKNAPPPPPPPPIALRPEQIRRTIAIVVDDLALSFDSTVRLRDSLKKWLDREMQPGDLVAVIRTSAGMGSLQQFTANKQVLSAAIDLVQYHLGRVGVSSFSPLTGAAIEGQIDTSAFDDEVQHAYTLGTLGAIQYVLQGLRDMPGRKSLILFSESMRLQFLEAADMVNTVSMNQQTDEERLRKLADAANRSSVVISAVDPRGAVYNGLTAEDNTRLMSSDQISQAASQRNANYIASQDGMVLLSQKTGGLFIPGDNDLAAALKDAVDDGDGYYLIGYQPDDTTFGEKASKRFHSVSVRVKRPGLHVRSRTGFFGTSDDRTAPLPETRQSQMTRAMASPFSSGAVRVKLTTLFSDAEKQGSYINAMLYVDAHDLTFTQEPDGNRVATMDVLAGTFDTDGQPVDGVDRTWQLRLPKKSYQAIMRAGLVYSAHVPVKKAGPYQMRVVLRDATSQQLGSATQFIDVPDLRLDRLTLSLIVLAALRPQNAAAGEQPSEGQLDADDPEGTPAVRIFKQGTSTVYAYQVLNARAGHDKKPQLEGQIRLFKDGRQVFASMPTPIASDDKHQNPKLLVGNGHLQLAQIPPGNYVLQLIIVDKLRKGKESVATQAIDFQVRQ